MVTYHCDSCGRPTGFKRHLGWGTFFMVLLTFGLWLFVLPFYPTRCSVCSTTKVLKMGLGVNLVFAAVAVFAIGWIGTVVDDKFTKTQTPAPIIDAYVVRQQREQARGATPTTQTSRSNTNLHLEPNAFSPGAISDGRTYSIALVNAANVPPHTNLFVQGKIAAFEQGAFGNAIRLRDEINTEKSLVCVVTNDEFADAGYLYPVGTTVQAFGTYVGAIDDSGTPLLQNCKLASAVKEAVRPSRPDPPDSPE